MPTLFDETFEYLEFSGGGYGSDGLWADGDASVSTVRGTIQPATGMEALRQGQGSRDGGLVKVYSSSELAPKERGTNDGGWVSKGGRVYQVDSEDAHSYLFGGHWVYTAHLVAPGDVPEAVSEVFG